ncbi:30S ribosomal protein S13 [Wolbachia endosymbiont of Dirofilaria (Dirofilaria) immitis]|uniref:30S ribosomal protein S13 n=1 Tax=Wolbachia endosymbiont of Dirofilaria (Dirofilaria) immitis TaxID=1812115 RepID=UPI0015891306|nr:30S ribosomal protein S13 [Wolbachia endosymbiont of Dirofilaria (Dirofilaria) immitis]QKX02177.1 30S ribosomal protein S13 [Wolbachia endosymbiont of Dirofilaria (Dirofilaria) immitis]
MVRIAGVNIPVKKCVPFALTYIYGIGIATANAICRACEINKNKRISELQDKDIERISSFIRQNYIIEGELRKEVAMNIKSLVEMGCYKGVRHRKGLPVRGQRTHTNAKTRKGRSHLPIAGKK